MSDGAAASPPLRLSELNKALECGLRAGMCLVKNIGGMAPPRRAQGIRDSAVLRVIRIITHIQDDGVCIDALNDGSIWARVIACARDNALAEEVVVMCVPDGKGHLSARGIARVLRAVEAEEEEGRHDRPSFESPDSESFEVAFERTIKPRHR